MPFCTTLPLNPYPFIISGSEIEWNENLHVNVSWHAIPVTHFLKVHPLESNLFRSSFVYNSTALRWLNWCTAAYKYERRALDQHLVHTASTQQHESSENAYLRERQIFRVAFYVICIKSADFTVAIRYLSVPSLTSLPLHQQQQQRWSAVHDTEPWNEKCVDTAQLLLQPQLVLCESRL